MTELLSVLYSLVWFWRSADFRRAKRREFVSRMYGRRVRRVAMSVGSNLEVLSRTNVTPTTSIGDDCVLDGVEIYGKGEVFIGNNVIIRSGTSISSSTRQPPVTIEDRVVIGANVIVLPGTHLGEGAIVEPGSVVRGDVPALAVVGGKPAEVLSWRE